jgi:hypothetical protein
VHRGLWRHARCVATLAPPDGVRAARRAIRGVSPGRPRRLKRHRSPSLRNDFLQGGTEVGPFQDDD